MSKTRDHIRTEVLELLRNHGQKAFRPKEIAKRLEYHDDHLYRLYREELDQMDEEGVVRREKGLRYRHLPKAETPPAPREAKRPVAEPRKKRPGRRRGNKVEGVLHVNAKGFGFVEVESREEDLFVREHNMATALDGDLVLVGLMAPKRGDDRRQECEVLEVVERRRLQTVGTFRRKGHFAFVEPDDQRLTQDVYVPREDFNGADDGDKVLVSIDRFDDRKASPEGRVLQVIGSGDDPGVRVLSLAMSYDVNPDFPDDVELEAEHLPTDIPEREVRRRLDLRGRKRIFTIDPEDAKDFDDAIHIERLENGHFEVGVHIADVSYYVQPGTALEAEALDRAVSVYLVDRTIPMLPEKLSNRVCSLRPDEDKLTFSCIMEVTPQGDVADYDIRETIIRSERRYTYDEAQQRLQGGYPDDSFSSDVVAANRLAKTLTARRLREGSVDFDLPEIKVELDDEGHPVRLYKKERMEANRLVEEFMLLANRTVSAHVGAREKAKPFVYRVHDRPDGERIRQLAEYIGAFGHALELTDGNVESTELNRLIAKVKGRPEEPVIQRAALQAMSKAVYSINNIGHYGLGFRHYSHFTSPIRRYPDLVTHRLLKRYALGQGPPSTDELESACDHCSTRERAAIEAERESVKLKQVEYIQQHLGETFDGVVSGVTKFGVFVELADVLVEGLVHVRDMDDYFEYDEATYSLIGENRGRIFRLGTKVRVQVTGASVENREIDLLFAD